MTDLVAQRVRQSAGRTSAKRLLPIAVAAGYQGSARNFRRLVAEQKALCLVIDWATVGGRRCGRPVNIIIVDDARWR